MSEATIRPYEPTWKDRLAMWMMGPDRPSPERRRFVGGLLGSTGYGQEGIGLLDMTPAGPVLDAQAAVQRGDYQGAALAMVPMPGAKGMADDVAKAGAKGAKKAAKEVAEAVSGKADDAANVGFKAYHGSPHHFDRFDMSKIGTGEGAQVYGHGLYFAEAEDVARAYRDGLSPGDAVWKNGAKVKPNSAEDIVARHWQESKANGESLDIFRKDYEWHYKQKIKQAKSAGKDASFYEDALKATRKFNPDQYEIKPSGAMYEVRVKANPDDVIDLGKFELKNQSESVKQKLLPLFGGDKDTLEASNLNDVISRAAPDIDDWDKAKDAAVSDKLKELGIPASRYFDQRSRAAGGGTRNFVVFDDSLIEILRKYGLVGGLLGGGAAYNLTQGQGGGGGI